MTPRTILFATGFATTLVISPVLPVFSQEAAANRIPQQIIVNGQPANGAYVRSPSGGIQSYRCPNPQQYSTPDGSTSGWACYEAATSTYLLSALPPASSQPAPVQVPYPLPSNPPAPASVPAPAPLPVPQSRPPIYGAPLPRNPPVFGVPGRFGSGRVKIETKIKKGSIYVDGGYAGITGKLKKFELEPGSHEIEIRDSKGHTVTDQHVQIAPGGTIEIRAEVAGQ